MTGNRWRTNCLVRVEYFPGPTSMEVLHKIQNDLQGRNIEPRDRVIFVSMFNDTDWTRKGTEEILSATWDVCVSWKRKEVEWRCNCKPEGKWNSSAPKMVLRFKKGISIKQARYFHLFLKDRNCEVCLRTKMTRTPCRRRTGEALPRTDIFGDLMTADHKVLDEEGESRNNHRLRCRC